MMFPFTIHAQETPTFTSSARDYRAAFLAVKPKEMSWFAFDVTVRSPNAVTFTVYGMRDNVTGGIGRQIAKIDASVDPSVARRSIEAEAIRIARARRAQELEAAEKAIVARYVAEVLRAVDEVAK